MDRVEAGGGSPAHTEETLRLGPLHLEVHRAIYGTIVVMTALALTDDGMVDGWQLAAVVLGPLVALAAAHAFSDLADRQIAAQRPLAGRDLAVVVRGNAQFLLVAVPPLVVLAGAVPSGWDIDEVTGVLLLLGMASLAFWGGLAAARAGLSRGWQVLYAAGYGTVGFVVVLLELMLSAH